MGVEAILGLLAFFVPSYLIPFGVITRVVRITSLSARARLCTIWSSTLVAAGTTLCLVIWLLSLTGTDAGPIPAVVGAVLAAALGWGLEFAGLQNAMTMLDIYLVKQGTRDLGQELEKRHHSEKPPRCPDGSPAQLVELPSFSGVHPKYVPAPDVRLTISGLWAYACPDESDVIHPPIRNFSYELYWSLCLYGMYSALPTTNNGSCSRCGARISRASKAHKGHLDGTVKLPRIPPLKVVYEGPVLSCPSCGTEEVGFPEGCRGIYQALGNATDNAGILEPFGEWVLTQLPQFSPYQPVFARQDRHIQAKNRRIRAVLLGFGASWAQIT